MTQDFEKAVKALSTSRRVVAMTGAGISVESGIPDFRSRGGLWTRFPPEEYATIEAFRRNPEKVWKMLAEVEKVLGRAEPNPAHRALYSLEKLGILEGVITQNIDGLHQRAGSKRVVEFHGSHASLTCLQCGSQLKREEAPAEMPPRCGCGAVYKPDVIFFGEAIPMQAMKTAQELSGGCRVMLVVGTSAEVAPASYMPNLAKKSGATVIEVNLAESALTRSVTDIFLKGSAGDILPRLAEAAGG